LASSAKIAESSAMSWAPPKSKAITIGANPITDIHFSITLPTTSLTFEVLNSS
jgi:hypothetical protein